jgi:hypothetical protein
MLLSVFVPHPEFPEFRITTLFSEPTLLSYTFIKLLNDVLVKLMESIPFFCDVLILAYILSSNTIKF